MAPTLTNSSFALAHRAELADNWGAFLDVFEPALRERLYPGTAKKKPLPPQAVDLQQAIHRTAEEAASRIRAASSDEDFRETALTAFRSQFGVEISLDPLGNLDRFIAESEQVATIGVFVVATRLMLYQALSSANAFNLDELDILRSTADAQRVANDLANLYSHARRRTGDFEIQFTPDELDDIVFADAASDSGDVGQRWGHLIYGSCSSLHALPCL